MVRKEIIGIYCAEMENGESSKNGYRKTKSENVEDFKK